MSDPKPSDGADASVGEAAPPDGGAPVEPIVDATAAPLVPPVDAEAAPEGLPGVAAPALAAPAPQARAKTKGVADLVFVVDVSGSMATCIDALRKNIEVFIDSLSRGDGNTAAPVRDWRGKVVGYRDIQSAESEGLPWVVDNEFVRDVGARKAQLAGLKAAAAAAKPSILPVIEVKDLDWKAIGEAVDAKAIRARMRAAVERMETLLDEAGGPGMLFDGDRTHAGDRALKVSTTNDASPLWIIGDLHGDLLALESALAQIRRHVPPADAGPARIVFLGDFFDDEGFGLEVLVRLFKLIVEAPQRVCVIAGNHDEALSYDGSRFASSVSPSDFADFLNANLAHEWIVRAGKLALRLTAHAPRALFFPDGLLVAHGGFPLGDLHAALAASGDWNDPACLSDFVWTRAHPKARRKMPNRFSRGSQFGYEDFADFCALSARLGRPITHMVRGHDHVEERYAIYPAYHAHPVLTTVALSRRLNGSVLDRTNARRPWLEWSLDPCRRSTSSVLRRSWSTRCFRRRSEVRAVGHAPRPTRTPSHERGPALSELRHDAGHER